MTMTSMMKMKKIDRPHSFGRYWMNIASDIDIDFTLDLFAFPHFVGDTSFLD